MNMAANLSAFLAQNVKKTETVKYPASKRMTDENGDTALWEIGCITASEHSKIRQSCMKQIPVAGGKRGQFTQSFDAAAYQVKISARCTVYPPLNDTALQDSYGVMSAEELIGVMLIAGELEDYSAKVLEVNGFQNDLDLVEEAKN